MIKLHLNCAQIEALSDLYCERDADSLWIADTVAFEVFTLTESQACWLAEELANFDYNQTTGLLHAAMDEMLLMVEQELLTGES